MSHSPPNSIASAREEGRAISDVFARGFWQLDPAGQLANCDDYELAPWFRTWLPDRQPVLEAGAGSGQWVAWCLKQGWRAAGLEWSVDLCVRASRFFPQAVLVAGDMRAMPWKDGSFGSILSLGSIEHASEGPMPSLNEYARVLRPGGIVIVSVPYRGVVRGLRHRLRSLVHFIRNIRRMSSGGESRAAAPTRAAWAPDFVATGNGSAFFQYNFSRRQMRGFFRAAGMSVLREAVLFHEDGIFHNFGRMAGRYCEHTGRIRLSPCGKLLKRLVPVRLSGHMVCYVVRKTGEAGSGAVQKTVVAVPSNDAG